MGPALSRLASQAVNKARVKKKIIGVARFSEPGLQEELNRDGIETIRADLLEDDQLRTLPLLKMFYTWREQIWNNRKRIFHVGMNAYLPGRVAQHFKDSRIVVFSTGNVYPLTQWKWREQMKM